MANEKGATETLKKRGSQARLLLRTEVGIGVEIIISACEVLILELLARIGGSLGFSHLCQRRHWRGVGKGRSGGLEKQGRRGGFSRALPR